MLSGHKSCEAKATPQQYLEKSEAANCINDLCATCVYFLTEAKTWLATFEFWNK